MPYREPDLEAQYLDRIGELEQEVARLKEDLRKVNRPPSPRVVKVRRRGYPDAPIHYAEQYVEGLGQRELCGEWLAEYPLGWFRRKWSNALLLLDGDWLVVDKCGRAVVTTNLKLAADWERVP